MPKQLAVMKWIQWKDSSSSSGWRSAEDINTEPLICESVGFLVKSDKNSTVLALSMANPDVCSRPIGDTIIIPTKCIVDMRTLK